MVEALSLHSPVSSDEETSSSSEDDNSPQRQDVRRVQEHQIPLSRREARANEYASLITDQKVIDTLNRTHLASKVKRAKTAKGMSQTEGKISNNMDFRNSSSEIFLLDSGAEVNLISEDIANNLKVKIYKLKQKRFVTEASGNMLNIIGSVEIYVQIPFVKSTKRLECLVLRGASENYQK